MDTKIFVFTALVALSFVTSSCGNSRSRSPKLAPPLEDSFSWDSEDDDNSLPEFEEEEETVTTVTKAPIIRQVIQETGYSTTEITVRTGRKLRLRFTPGIQNRNVDNTGFTPNYSKLGVYITVGSMTQSTPMLRNGFAGGAAQSSPSLEYSYAVREGCPSSQPDCRQEVTITVHKPNNDYWCLNFQSYCPYTHVYESHPWNGELEIETDDTQTLESVSTE